MHFEGEGRGRCCSEEVFQRGCAIVTLRTHFLFLISHINVIFEAANSVCLPLEDRRRGEEMGRAEAEGR